MMSKGAAVTSGVMDSQEVLEEFRRTWGPVSDSAGSRQGQPCQAIVGSLASSGDGPQARRPPRCETVPTTRTNPFKSVDERKFRASSLSCHCETSILLSVGHDYSSLTSNSQARQ